MKTQIIIRFLLFVFVAISFTNCSKSDAINPNNLADTMVGSYAITQVITGGRTITLPVMQGNDQQSGVITVSKISTTNISILFVVTTISNGKTDRQTSSGEVEVKQNGNSIDLYEDATFTSKVGNFTGGTLILDVGSSKITAKKN